MSVRVDGITREAAVVLFKNWSDQLADARELREHYGRVEEGLETMLKGISTIYPDLAAAGEIAAPQSVEAAIEAPAIDGGADAQLDPPGRRRPAGMSAVDTVATVVSEAEGQEYLTVPQIVDELERRGWTPVAANVGDATRAALSRAVQRGLIEARRLDGRTNGYRRISSTDTSSAAETALDVGVPSRGGGGEETYAQDAHDPDHDATGWDRDHRSDPPVRVENF